MTGPNDWIDIFLNISRTGRVGFGRTIHHHIRARVLHPVSYCLLGILELVYQAVFDMIGEVWSLIVLTWKVFRTWKALSATSGLFRSGTKIFSSWPVEQKHSPVDMLNINILQLTCWTQFSIPNALTNFQPTSVDHMSVAIGAEEAQPPPLMLFNGLSKDIFLRLSVIQIPRVVIHC